MFLAVLVLAWKGDGVVNAEVVVRIATSVEAMAVNFVMVEFGSYSREV